MDEWVKEMGAIYIYIMEQYAITKKENPAFYNNMNGLQGYYNK